MRLPPGVCKGALVACGSTLRRRRDEVAFSGVTGLGLLSAFKLTCDEVGVLCGGATDTLAETCLRILFGVSGTLGMASRSSSISYSDLFPGFLDRLDFVEECVGSNVADNLRF